MANFTRCARCASVNLPIDNDAASDAGTKRNVENVTFAASRAELHLSVCGGRSIVLEQRGDAELLAH